MRQHEHYKPFDSGYVSDFDQFMHDYLDRHPDVVEDQREGWYIWWDHRVDLDELERQRKADLPVKAYQYD